MLAEIEATDLGVLLGRDHQGSPAARPPTAIALARSTRSPAGRRHSAAWDQEQAAQHSARGARRRPAVWRHPGGPGKCDPSRGGGRDTRADGRGGRVALPASRDAAPSRHARSVGGQRPGSTASRRRDRGHRPSTSQTERRRCGTPSGATGRRPWRRLSSDDRPLDVTGDSVAQLTTTASAIPWRVRGGHEGPEDQSGPSPLPCLPSVLDPPDAADVHRRPWTLPDPWTRRRAHRSLPNRTDAVSHKRPPPSSFS